MSLIKGLNKSDQHIYKICITGGPCGGKTSAMNHLRKHLEGKGMRVIIVPELPTQLIHSGVMIMMKDFSLPDMIYFQCRLIEQQMATESYFMDIARMCKVPTAVICDRGVVDPRAYVSEEVYQSMLDLKGWTRCHLRDSHYDAVIFMETAANGAEDFYTLENNVARYEGLEDARRVNDRTKLAYMGHPNYFYVDNRVKSFAEKLDNVVERIDYYMENKGECRRRLFLVEAVEWPLDLPKEEFEVTQTILKDSTKNYQLKLVKRGQDKNYTYYVKEKRELEDGSFRIRKMFINASEYLDTITAKHPERKSLSRKRTLFLYKGHLYRYDFVEDKRIGLLMSEEEDIPPFVKSCKDITTDPAYMSYALSKD